ncbi:sucrase/ferredoxin-like family protein [Lyngbya aestuarii BL J]|uniref:Sucrase/ferredoxin-like family protein n=1 Tax=Lyngbya aestuarii BL J TaxID=1348334 RepID=U7QFN5_9CYAN|nr:sucrase ferredoxin [Lyngbya aestuarii]ERT06764.1 sucrase/ferredoxin-like family protein [Lyngbya aestuarii BL J]
MITTELVENKTECTYCNVFSKANGVDPIGTAPTVEQWLIVEVPQPWTSNPWKNHPRLQPVVELLKQWEQLNPKIMLRPLLVVPDEDYSKPGFVRIFHYSRLNVLFSQFEKQEYLVPETELSSVVNALLIQPQHLEKFAEYRQNTQDIRDILVCTHTDVDRACGRFGYPLYLELRQKYAANSPNKLRIWQTNHFGGHQFAPTLIDFPSGRFWGHLESDILDLLLHKKGNLVDLKPYYRGWSSLGKFEQIAEREIWDKEGWHWLNYQKSGRVIRQDKGGVLIYILKQVLRFIPLNKAKILRKKLEQKATWVDVRIEYSSPDDKVRGAYEARVQVNGKVLSLLKSGEQVKPKPIQQYQVSRLVKVN